MNDLDRIVQSLATAPLSARDFERFAQDTLVDVYPGLSPIPGGTDWGRDADIAAPADGNPVRLIATSSRTLDGIRKNMRRGLKSMADHGVVVERIALANPANLGLLQRQKLAHAAAAANVRLDVSDIFDGNFVASRLRRDGYWRKRLLGLPSEPLSLSRTSPDLAEGPGGFLPFVARTSELESIRGDGDLILTGPPGVGKTRLVSELDDVAFVDKDASFEQVTADLRWATPTVVVIDDAGRAMQLVRRIRSLRAREPDLFTFRMIAICWPHEVDDVAIELSGATLRELALIERKPLDDLLRAMGVNAQIARAEILDQAEGRPGWVITLAQLLLQSDDTTALITGRAVFDQVDRYLRRTGIGAAAIPVLAIVAALGGIVEGELTALAKEVELSRAETIRTLTAAMKSGLIDTHETYDPAAEQSVRTYLVRPPTLAEALVAQRAFEAEIPTLDFDGLIERWPDKRYGLACAAVNAAVRQAHRARGRGESLVLQVLHDHEVHVAAKVRLATLFMQVDRSAAEIVVSEARGSFDAMLADGSAAAETIEPIVELAARGTRWYQDPAAILILLDASLLDGRGTNQHPRHPLRELQNLIVEAHPELPRDRELRYAIAAIATTWFQSREDEPVRDEVVAKVFQILLSISLRSAYSAPGDPMTLQLIESIVPAEEMPRILDELWPQAATLIDAGAAAVADALVDVAGSWLHVGHDYDHPFGRSHPADRLAAARQIGERLVDALANRSDLSLGTRARLAATAEDYGLAYDPLVPAEFAPFFRDLDRDDDWEAALERLNDELRATAHKWSGESPQPAMQRLADLKTQSGRAQTRWPDRIWQTASFLAEAVADPGEWLQAAFSAGLSAEAGCFVDPALATGTLPREPTLTLLTTPASRAPVLAALLANSQTPAWARDAARSSLAPGDFGVIETVIIRQKLTVDLVGELLADPRPDIRAMIALAYFGASRRELRQFPGALGDAWRHAVRDLRPSKQAKSIAHEITTLFRYMTENYPDDLLEIIAASIGEANATGVYGALPHECWELLALLPAPQKLTLWQRFKSHNSRWILLPHLIGTDSQWLEQILQSGETTADEAIGCLNGLGPRPPIDELAKMLVPRGIDPGRIASLRFAGMWTGEQSDRYRSIAESFRELGQSSDPNVAAVGDAGARMFTEAQAEAEHREYQQRVRGDR